jgi:membrane-associated phospholipid phosphatase
MKRWLHPLLRADAHLSNALLIPEEKLFLSFVLKIFAHSGDSWFWLAGLLSVWFFSQGEWQQRAVFLGVGLVFMAVAVILLKFTIRRPRPQGEWGKIYRTTDPHSFPSGHAARSAALAVLGIAIGPPWFGIALVLWAPWVGLSRVALGVHYLSDVVAGWMVGISMSFVALAVQPLVMQFVNRLL